MLIEQIPHLPKHGQNAHVGQLYGSSLSLLLAELLAQSDHRHVILTSDMAQADQLHAEIGFFSPEMATLWHLPDWETLPYDAFSPHPDIVSERLQTLAALLNDEVRNLILPVSALLPRLPPRDYIRSRVLLLKIGQTLDPLVFRERLTRQGYRMVAQVEEHGEYSVRGSILDLFPMGSEQPFRLEFMDDEIETIRQFDSETQISTGSVDHIKILPAQEYPLDEEGIQRFRQSFRQEFDVDPRDCPIYRDISDGYNSAGVEYYLPLFFEHTETLFDYLKGDTRLLLLQEAEAELQEQLVQIQERYESRRYNLEYPLLKPQTVFLDAQALQQQLAAHPCVYLSRHKYPDSAGKRVSNLPTQSLPSGLIQPHAEQPAAFLLQHLEQHTAHRILFCAESTGRREYLLELLQHYHIRPQISDQWPDFLADEHAIQLTVAPLADGLRLADPAVEIITEQQLTGARAQQSRRRKFKATRDSEAMIQSLADLKPGAPVVHEDHGVGRFQGLQTLDVGGTANEYLCILYANDDKLYVPVSSLHLISRFTGASEEAAPLHRLGTEQWSKARKKAAEKIRDVAAELLEIQARRAARPGQSLLCNEDEYQRFSGEFPFEETPDQLSAIQAVEADLRSDQPTDRIVCGDVGFGKTEVGMRAAFIAANSGKQVVVLVPTTLLAQQHYQNFADRFADWPFKIANLSRFSAKKSERETIEQLKNGQVDIVIGTHKLLSESVQYKNLGLIIIDEEHRFGVRHKEKLKSLRADVDMLTLTATPIPRTLNMSLAGLRDLSIIATPPQRRLAVKTFVSQWRDELIQEGCMREFKRGGQVYFLHNEVKSIAKMADQLQELMPDARIGIAHGQMQERELEQVMLDFYHHRCNLLVCTTIIESGIDVPTANTILINRADKLGLAQLHQIRGRVGRSHHRAYAYLLTPHPKAITGDAQKRLTAIESHEELGVGFTLATHDLEIRGAGELLGEGQSGQISQIGFTLYSELLERAVQALKSGRAPDVDNGMHRASEVDIHRPALIPEDYMPDVHFRLVEYKRISAAADEQKLKELQIEYIDRFGLLPEPLKALFAITRLKQRTREIGIRKIDISASSGKIEFEANPQLDPMRLLQLIQSQPHIYRFDGQQVLRFQCDSETAEERIDTLNQLLDTLQEKQAA